MTPARVVLLSTALAFVAAEAVRPTHVPAKRSSLALLVHSQSEKGDGYGVRDSLDPLLLDDLPRIHPDVAATDVRAARQRDGSFRLYGILHGNDAGSAVFVESDGKRLAGEQTIYGKPSQPRAFAIVISPRRFGPGEHRLRVALVSADKRGFFLVDPPITVRVARAS